MGLECLNAWLHMKNPMDRVLTMINQPSHLALTLKSMIERVLTIEEIKATLTIPVVQRHDLYLGLHTV